jgi:5'-nucleotidase
MKTLVINDDGIKSPGLWAAVRALRRVGEVFVVAPAKEQSGVGASLTLHSPVKVIPWTPDDEFQEAGNGLHPVTAYSAGGTPGDCCILALETLTTGVDLVVSGINSGSNCGWDVMVSGTVGGAVQGFNRGHSTIAVSVGSVTAPRYEVAGRLLEGLARRLSQREGEPLFLNLNVPNVAPDMVKGIRATRLGGLSYRESVRLERTEGDDRHYRIARNRPGNQAQAADSDIQALKDNYVSITPLRLGMGDDAGIPEVEALLDGLMD